MNAIKSYEFQNDQLHPCKDIQRYGVYILVWKRDGDPGGVVYVGQAKNVISRIRTHAASADNSGWDYAYAIVSDCFHTTTIKELEARLIAYMQRLGRLRKRQNFSFEKQIKEDDRNQVDAAYHAILSLFKSADQDFFRENDMSGPHPGENLLVQDKPGRTYVTVGEIESDLLKNHIDSATVLRVKEALSFCAAFPDVNFVKRTDQRHLRYAATVGNRNFCIFDVMDKWVRLNIALNRNERDNSCAESTVTNEKFCMHDLGEDGLSEFLKGHIRKAYECRKIFEGRMAIEPVVNREGAMGTDSSDHASHMAPFASARVSSDSKPQLNKPCGDEAVRHARAKLSSSLQLAFDALVDHLQRLRPLEIKWRGDNCLNFAKGTAGKQSKTAIMLEPRPREIRVHLFFENESPRRSDERLKERGSKDKKRARYIEIKDSKDVDSALRDHIIQVWEAH